MSTTPVSSSSSSSSFSNGLTSVSKSRWRLLSAAILKRDPDKNDVEQASIHRFSGLQLMRRRRVGDTAEEECVALREALLRSIRQFSSAEGDDESLLEECILALQCCCPQAHRRVMLTTRNRGSDLSPSLRERLARRGISCRPGEHHHTLQFPSYDDYALLQYYLDGTCTTSPLLLTRERLSNAPASLRSLTSHRHHDGVDNTGNTCVWDSEMTLSYCLVEACRDGTSQLCKVLGVASLWEMRCTTTLTRMPLRVLELGAGMAGLAGLSLAQIASCQYEQSLELLITDGHIDAVHHNRVSSRINRVRNGDGTNKNVKVSCEKLLWTDDVSKLSPQQFDICLASDCTHFQEYHACLALTCARMLRVGGVVVLCQPARGRSLQNFMSLIQCSLSTVLEIVKWWQDPDKDVYDEKVYGRHREAVQDERHAYDPKIHYPQLIVLRKLRELTEDDRRRSLQQMQERSL